MKFGRHLYERPEPRGSTFRLRAKVIPIKGPAVRTWAEMDETEREALRRLYAGRRRERQPEESHGRP